MADILSGVLSGGVYGKRFRPLGDFTAAMDDMLQALHDTPRADGQERIYTAGEPEAETERVRRAQGIPVAPALVRQCNQIAGELGVTPLA